MVRKGKSKFAHYYHDLSFKTSIAISLFTAGLLLSLLVPQSSLIILVLFSVLYYIDKYNLMYYYPLEFESSSISRKILIKNSFFAILQF